LKTVAKKTGKIIFDASRISGKNYESIVKCGW